MKRWLLGFGLCFPLLLSAQSDNTVYVKQFQGGDVGTKVTNAMASCNTSTSIPCILVIDASLAPWPAGTLPSLCGHCYLQDWRTGSPSLPSSVNLLSLNAVQLVSPTATDQCTAIAAALAALPATGGKIDASGVPGNVNCAGTLTINVPSTEIIFGSGTTTFSGCPGINVAAANITIRGKGSSQPYNTLLGTTLKSGSACPLIEDNTGGADNFHLFDLSLNGNSGVGTFGVLAPQGAGNQYTNVTPSGFKYQGIVNTQGVAKLDSVWSNNNGEGALIASDTTVYGQSEFELNTPGSGLHIIGGGGFTFCQSCDHNGFWGLYLDGRAWSDWAASTSYTQFQVIIPTTNNAGGYAFESTVAASSSATRPTFPQTLGATVTDGSQTWINIGVEVASNTVSYAHIGQTYANENGQTGSGGDIIVDGGSGTMADHVYLDSIHTSQQNSPTKAVCGTKINHATNVVVHGIGFYGSNFGGSGTDLGALCIVGSSSIEVEGLTSELSATTPVSITGSSFDVHVIGASISSVGSSGTPTASTYCAHIDTSFRTIIDDFACLGSNSWAHGIFDTGTDSSISNYKNYTTNAGFSGGAPVNDTFSGSWSNVDENGTVFSSKVLQNCGTMTTTAATSNSLTCGWVNAASLCSVTPSNSTSVAWTYYTPSAGSITVFHASTAGATYAIACSPN